jgi:Acetyltransferase (GNAT) domain
MMVVEPLRPGERTEWDEFLLGQPGGLVYHSTAYRDLLADHIGCEPEYLVAREAGEIRAVLPIMWTAAAHGRVANSLPFYGSHGAPLAVSRAAGRMLLEAWNERATDPATLAATMVSNPFAPLGSDAPVHNLTDQRISQVTPLPAEADEEGVIALVASSARRNVRKAERLGIEVGIDHHALGTLWRIHDENMQAIGGRAKARDFFDILPRHLRPSEQFDLWVARSGDEVVAGLLVLYFGAVAEYFTPAVAQEHRGDQPLAAILVRAMAHAATRGCRLWNWGGTWTAQDGVRRFKSKWGAADTSYPYWTQLNEDSLLDSEPEELQREFGHFYIAPFSALRERGALKSPR